MRLCDVAKKAAEGIVNCMLGEYGKWLSKSYDIRNTIVLSGVPRGGTTWLYEVLLSAIPRSCGIWEPLFLYNDPRLKDLKFSWREHIDPARQWKEAELLFRDILTGRNLNLGLIYGYSIVDFARKMTKAEKYVVKFCRANRLLGWMVERIGIRTPVLLIRHPCAVVASQMTHGGWNHVWRKDRLEHPLVNPEFARKEPWIMELMKYVKTPEERLAITWCLDYYIPLSQAMPHPWVLICYERMVTQAEEEGRRLFDALGQEAPRNLGAYLARPSATTKWDSNVLSGGDRLSTWKKRLTEEQQENILSIVSAFGLDFYTGRLEPDYDRLYENPIKKSTSQQ